MILDIDFKDLEYLKAGNKKQKRAFEVLTANEVMVRLEEYDPILIGTIPINIDIEKSDLDIVCCFTDANSFQGYLIKTFGKLHGFKTWKNTSQESLAIVANFFIEGLEIEIFGQNIPTDKQRGYRHMLIEHKILQQRGEEFRQRIIQLKEQGYKTEPAFAYELGLEGDPYEALLKL